MKPLVLTLRAFGPFAGEQSVDFTRTGTNPFLLINGPTGAGKTSLLDGLCFALYGKASGEAREKQNDRYLRSQWASPEAECSVSLRFQVGARRFLIKRMPTQFVLSRGKPVERKHRVEFCELDAEGVVLGEQLSKVGEVDARVEELVGFTCEQFRQVMVLPQGEFRRLLLAKSDEKEKILQKLFGTEKYKLAEEALKRRRTALFDQLTGLRTGMEAILSAKGATGVEELESRLAEGKLQLQERKGELSGARLRLAEAQARAAEAQAVDKDFAERDQAAAALDRLLAGTAAADEQARRADRAFKALEHADLETAILQAGQAAKDREVELRRLALDIEALTGQRVQALAVLEQARQERDKAPERAAEQERLGAQLRQLQERDAARKAVAQAGAGEAAARAQAEQAAARVAACDQRLAELSTEIETLSLQAGERARLDLDITRLDGLTAQRKQLETLLQSQSSAQAALTGAEAQISGCAAELAAARQTRQEAQQALLAGQASRLAAGLAAGAPCPVCGATDHPHPAAHVEGLPADEDLEQAERRERLAQQALDEARRGAEASRTRLAGFASGLEHCRAALGEEAQTPVSALAARLREAKSAQTRAVAHAQRLERCRQEREPLAASRGALLARQNAAEQARVRAAEEQARFQALLQRAEAGAGDADAAGVQLRLEELARSIPLAEKNFQAAQSALAGVESRLSTRQGERASLAQVAQAAVLELEEQRRTFDLRLLTDGFHTQQEYREAKLPRARAEALRQEAAKFQESLAAARDRLARAEDASAGKTRPDMTGIVAAQQEAAAVVDRLNHDLGELGTRQEGLLEALRAIGEKAERTRELEAQYRIVGGLAKLAGGDNPLRMTLQRYVLAALFEEVARAASERLLRMSRGRYHLVRADAARDGRSTGGLDLDVTDAFIGETRPASTLSGGESFLAALALALGLSDVVMAQQGGRSLDCIFIDEGFGSLDGETLEDALNTLMELNDAGRLIGIISHVGELKERIDARIDVLPSKAGSSIKQVNC